MPSKTELYVLITRKGDIHGFTLRIRNQRIRLCDDAQCPIAFFVRNAGELQHDLIRIVILRRDHGENDASWFLHVGLDDVLYKLDIGSRLLFCFRMDQSRKVYDSQVWPIRT